MSRKERSSSREVRLAEKIAPIHVYSSGARSPFSATQYFDVSKFDNEHSPVKKVYVKKEVGAVIVSPSVKKIPEKKKFFESKTPSLSLVYTKS